MPGRRRFAGLEPHVHSVAVHLTRIDRDEEIAEVRILYAKMTRENAQSGCLFLYGDEDDAPDDFSDRLSLLAHEKRDTDDFLDFWGEPDDVDWPDADDIFSTLNYRDPIPVRDRGKQLLPLLKNHCDDECRNPEDVFRNVARNKRLCIVAFAVPRDDTRRICIAKHVQRFIELADITASEAGSAARFLFIYRFEAEKVRAQIDQLHACQKLFKDEPAFPYARIEKWGEVSVDHVDEWRGHMHSQIIRKLGNAGDQAVTEASKVLLEFSQKHGGIKLGRVIDTLVDHLKATQDGNGIA